MIAKNLVPYTTRILHEAQSFVIMRPLPLDAHSVSPRPHSISSDAPDIS